MISTVDGRVSRLSTTGSAVLAAHVGPGAFGHRTRPASPVHDEVASDEHNPALYPNGPVRGLDIGADTPWKLDVATIGFRRSTRR